MPGETWPWNQIWSPPPGWALPREEWLDPTSQSAPALGEGAGVDAGGGVALEPDLGTAAGVVLAAEEVVEPDLVERGGAGVGGDVPPAADPGPPAGGDQDAGVHRGVGA